MKETNASLLYECVCQCYILRFEERAKEFILMAKANLKEEAIAKAICMQLL